MSEFKKGGTPPPKCHLDVKNMVDLLPPLLSSFFVKILHDNLIKLTLFLHFTFSISKKNSDRGLEKKSSQVQNLALSKKSTISSNLADILANSESHEIIIFTKVHEDRRKIVDFLRIANFCARALFSCSPSR